MKKIKLILMIIRLLTEKATGIIICRDKKETLKFATGDIKELSCLIEAGIVIDKQFGDILTVAVLCDILAKGEAPAIINEQGRRKLIKILSEDTMKQDKQ